MKDIAAATTNRTFCTSDYFVKNQQTKDVDILVLHTLDLCAALMALMMFAYRSWRVKKIARETELFCLSTLENRMLYNAFRKHLFFNMCTFVGSAMVLITVILFDTFALLVITIDICANVLLRFFFIFYCVLSKTFSIMNVNEEDWEMNDLLGGASYRMIKAASYVRKRLTLNSRDISMLREHGLADSRHPTLEPTSTETDITSIVGNPQPDSHFTDGPEALPRAFTYSTEVRVDTLQQKDNAKIASTTPITESNKSEDTDVNIATSSDFVPMAKAVVVGQPESVRYLQDHTQKQFQALIKQTERPVLFASGEGNGSINLWFMLFFFLKNNNNRAVFQKKPKRRSNKKIQQQHLAEQPSKFEALNRMQLVGFSKRHLRASHQSNDNKDNNNSAEMITKKKEQTDVDHRRIQSDIRGHNDGSGKPKSPKLFQSQRMVNEDEEIDKPPNVSGQPRVSNSMDVQIPNLLQAVKARYYSKDKSAESNVTHKASALPSSSPSQPPQQHGRQYSDSGGDIRGLIAISSKSRSSERTTPVSALPGANTNTRNARSAMTLPSGLYPVHEEKQNVSAHVRGTSSMFFIMPSLLLRQDHDENTHVSGSKNLSDAEHILSNLKRNSRLNQVLQETNPTAKSRKLTDSESTALHHDPPQLVFIDNANEHVFFCLLVFYLSQYSLFVCVCIRLHQQIAHLLRCQLKMLSPYLQIMRFSILPSCKDTIIHLLANLFL
ncbi:hypothetical protein RFI_09500 [Reticulomyxa filosa]|uniref:Uncharacterized protein n=1 Tax=Reticulomyxa filosa TaxID=46433 RepID=X6NNW6_RETFI|nr:hypothetical protein RFI_09500 [Reticulomyxa filosa]|eukprot:ETO27633.1 hypothetical protein RFI_09500 [Reticulomyxa filosa]